MQQSYLLNYVKHERMMAIKSPFDYLFSGKFGAPRKVTSNKSAQFHHNIHSSAGLPKGNAMSVSLIELLSG